MKSNVNEVSVHYGDAKISFLNITLDKEIEGEIWHSHSYYEIHFAGENCITYYFEDKKMVLYPGEMLIIPPKTKHKTAGAEIFAIPMSLSQIAGEQNFYTVIKDAIDKNAFAPLPFSHGNLKCFLREDFFHTVLGVCKLKSVATEFVYNLLYLLIKNKNPHILSSQKDALLLIDGLVYCPDVTLDDLSRVTNYSKRHIARLIKRHYGKTLSQIKREADEGKNEEI